jgi:hypothetical protein
MKRRGTARRGRLVTAILAGSLVAAACSGAPTASTGTGASLAASSAPADGTTAPAASPADGSALPTDPGGGSTPPIDLATDVCAPFAGGARPPATAAETELLDAMPKTVDGGPVSDPKANQAMQTFCSGTDDGNEVVRVIAEDFGIDLRTVVLGRFGATVDAYSTLVEAIRAPGEDGNAVLPAFAVMGITIHPGEGTKATVAGKDVLYREVNGGRRYQFVDGDTIWFFTVKTEAQAAAVIAAFE